MSERYLPTSEFLNHVIAGEISFDGSPLAEENLRQLLGMVNDPDKANRDWAAFVISGLPYDTPEIRAALIKAAGDRDLDARDEAIVGLARRDREEALARLGPLLIDDISLVLVEAVTILGEPSLLPALKTVATWEGGGERFVERLQQAIAACETGVGVDSWPDGDRPYLLSTPD